VTVFFRTQTGTTEGFGFITPDDEESALNSDSDAPKKKQLKGAQAVYVRLQDEVSLRAGKEESGLAAEVKSTGGSPEAPEASIEEAKGAEFAQEALEAPIEEEKAAPVEEPDVVETEVGGEATDTAKDTAELEAAPAFEEKELPVPVKDTAGAAQEGGLLVIAFVVPMAQYYAYVSKK
jgi:hypothetical protein